MLIKFLQFMREGNINRVLYVIFRDGEFLCMDYRGVLMIIYFSGLAPRRFNRFFGVHWYVRPAVTQRSRITYSRHPLCTLALTGE
jgi:hypothetical protein